MAIKTKMKLENLELEDGVTFLKDIIYSKDYRTKLKKALLRVDDINIINNYIRVLKLEIELEKLKLQVAKSDDDNRAKPVFDNLYEMLGVLEDKKKLSKKIIS